MTYESPIGDDDLGNVSGPYMTPEERQHYREQMKQHASAKQKWSSAIASANMGPKMNPENAMWYGTSGQIDTRFMFYGPYPEDEKRIRKVFGDSLTPVQVVRVFRMQQKLTEAITRGNHYAREYEDLKKSVTEMFGGVLSHIVEDY